MLASRKAQTTMRFLLASVLDAAEATPDEKAEDAEATADEKAEATAVGLGTAAAQWPKAGMQTRSSHRKAPSAFV